MYTTHVKSMSNLVVKAPEYHLVDLYLTFGVRSFSTEFDKKDIRHK
jgi:predicted GNAT family N-acyltransferase